MSSQIKTLYVTHHSHTDIGYTDLQERVIDTQVDYIRTVLRIMNQPENKDFRWNCETLFCVEQFLERCDPGEREAFFALARAGKIGISANYLNFCDLVDCETYSRRLEKIQAVFTQEGAPLCTAMIADINGISMGYRDAMLRHGVTFLLANIHCHHGMYPLYQNQTAFWWENATGQRLLVWNGEHYNLGNVLGLKPNRTVNFMMENHLGRAAKPDDPVSALHQNLEAYVTLCQENGYPYDFLLASVSGVFSDNAPPETEILRVIQAYNQRYGETIRIRMVSLQELYTEIAPALRNAPVYRGDMTDWWANGAGSTPYAVKHYKDALWRYRLCRRLQPDLEAQYPVLCKTVEDQLLLYAEHTWGHSSTIENPYDTMVLHLDMRKNSYAAKAHEAASTMLNRIAMAQGDIMRYYATQGTVSARDVSGCGGRQVVSFYIESTVMARAEVADAQGRRIPCQVSPHPRGRLITFVDDFFPGEKKRYTYAELPAEPGTLNSRKCYVGAERVRDIVNEYDPVTYRIPYEFENAFFRLSYRAGEGITEFVDKRTGRNLLEKNTAPFFTPLHEITTIRVTNAPCPEQEERRKLGRNIRGPHVVLTVGKLEEILCQEQGAVFTQLCLRFALPGTVRADVILRLYEAIPRIDFTLALGKTLSTDIESIFLPLSLDFPEKQVYLRKGTEAFRPGVDQLPGTCMEYSMSDDGIAMLSASGGAIIASRDVPLVYMGEMRHHPIRLCDGAAANNSRPVYSWIMNNTWETNFKMDLSGFGEYRYTLWLTEETNPEKAMELLRNMTFDPYIIMESNA